MELDVSATGIKGNSATGTFPSGSATISESFGNDVKLLGSARGRLGWAPDSSWLLYGTGGLAWERLDQTFAFSNIVPGGVAPGSFFNFDTSTPVNLFGWVAGAGVEARLWGTNWIGRLEYLHYDLGHSRNSQVITTSLPGQSQTSTAGNQTIDVVRAGLSYKFGS